MKKLILAALLFASSHIYGQYCGIGFEKEEPYVTAGVMGDYSLRYFGKENFAGMNVSAGVWIDHVGIFAGYAVYKLREEWPIGKTGFITLAARYKVFDDHVQINPFVSVGLQKYEDVGIRLTYKLGSGQYLGIVASHTMHYGITTVWSIF